MPAAKFRWFVTVLIAMAVLGVAAGLALSRARDSAAGDRQENGPAGDTRPGGNSSSGDPFPAPAGSITAFIDDYPSAPAFDGPDGWNSSTHRAKTGRTPVASAGPVIVTFHVARQPACSSGTGGPVVLKWKVTGAKKTTLSVDGPGVYATFGAEDTATIDFPCSGNPGDEQAHTYTLAVAGPEGTESRTLTVTARVDGTAAT